MCYIYMEIRGNTRKCYLIPDNFSEKLIFSSRTGCHPCLGERGRAECQGSMQSYYIVIRRVYQFISLSAYHPQYWRSDILDILQYLLQSTDQPISRRNGLVGSQYFTKNTGIIMSGKALKSQLSDTMLNGEQLSSETDHSNFADFKPGRPESYKIEFKKARETLEMKGEVWVEFLYYTVHQYSIVHRKNLYFYILLFYIYLFLDWMSVWIIRPFFGSEAPETNDKPVILIQRPHKATLTDVDIQTELRMRWKLRETFRMKQNREIWRISSQQGQLSTGETRGREP